MANVRSLIREVNAGEWTYYAVWLLLLIGEGSVVGFLTKVVAKWLGLHHPYGACLAWVIFVVGGVGLGYIFSRKVEVGQDLHGPILRSSAWLMYRKRQWGWLGFVLVATLWGAPTGVCMILKRDGQARRLWLTTFAAVLFASLWVPVFTTIWRQT